LGTLILAIVGIFIVVGLVGFLLAGHISHVCPAVVSKFHLRVQVAVR
jgi:hypothetical protein